MSGADAGAPCALASDDSATTGTPQSAASLVSSRDAAVTA